MLAQNFMSADYLQISESHKDALIKTLALLETGRMTHIPIVAIDRSEEGNEFTGGFNMGTWRASHGCGTAACIGGTAELVGRVRFDDENYTDALDDLFYPTTNLDYEKITINQAATALRGYLTTGQVDWTAALA